LVKSWNLLVLAVEVTEIVVLVAVPSVAPIRDIVAGTALFKDDFR
jgi:hypothetical protein